MRLLSTLLPDQSPAHVRYILASGQRRRSAGQRWLVRIGTTIGIAALVIASYVFYRSDEALLIDSSITPDWFAVLYAPLVIGQGIAWLAALVLASMTIADEQRRGTWEAFKITSHGAEQLVRAQWLAALYRLRWLLIALIAPRIVFAGIMLADMTDYQGHMLDLHMTGITPDGMPLEAGIILLAALMTAALLQVVVLTGLNAAVGLVIAAYFEKRAARFIAQTVAVMVQVGGIALAIAGGQFVLDGDMGSAAWSGLSMTDRWLRLVGLGTVGDAGLRFMDLQTFLRTWTDVDYGVLLGAAILAVMAVQVVATDGLLRLARRRAARPTRE
ncbi:MAG: hypothetical protein JXQ72_03560 [Anaerolineae bacterium]|nr:hypothetical protein [Anaerolineae bacterium]